ncbi:MAG TPA: Ldh family oxidoreductase, partial [Chloroflexota bacterium]
MAGDRVCMAGALQQFVAAVCAAMGADADIASEVASHLVRANLSGHDSHGVIRIPQYVAQADQGELLPGARPAIMKETTVGALIDAGRGFGHFSTSFALQWAMERAGEHGLAAAAVRHSSHIGRLGEYTEHAAERGLIAMVTVGAAGPGVGGVNLYGGRKRFFGANPWSIGVPALEHLPVVFDGSTSAIAEGKVRVARAKGAQLPPGCIVDAEGNPSTDPADFYAGGALVPLGGEVAGHKGYGLSLASALLSGLAMIDDSEPTLIGASSVQDETDTRGRMAGVFLTVIDPALFGNSASYSKMVDETLAAAKRVPPAAGTSEILIPGEPEARSRDQRGRSGITLPEATWNDLLAVAERYGV